MKNFTNRIKQLNRRILSEKKTLVGLKKHEARVKAKWTKEYWAYENAVDQLTEIKNLGTKKHLALKQKIGPKGSYRKRSIELTKQRDELRKCILAVEATLARLESELAVIREQEISGAKATDEVVTQVFSLNDAVVHSSRNREDFLNRHIFPKLIDEKGSLVSQVSITSSNGLRRVVAMVNTMTIVQSDMAAEAKRLIEEFFERFQVTAAMDSSTRTLYDLTRQLLTEKTAFKVGPDLYRFLAMELNGDDLSELNEAQRLLRLSIRSEKTNSYIRIHERESMKGKWQPVRQS